MNHVFIRILLLIYPGMLSLKFPYKNSVYFFRIFRSYNFHCIALLHHAVTVEYNLFPFFFICFAKVQQGRNIRKRSSLGRFGARNFNLPFSPSTIEIFPSDYISINRTKLIIEWEGVVIINKNKTFINGQFLEKLY